MRLLNIKGRFVYKNVRPYLINWEGKSRSKLQFCVKQFFKKYWMNHVCFEEFPVFGSRMTVDILNASKKIAVEVQGDQHSQYNEFFHKKNRMDYFFSIKRDVQKAEWLEKNGFKLLELEGGDIDSLSPEYILAKFDIHIL